MCVFDFFKQKTAYEMRISDWSSDVCSSDLFMAGSGNLTAAMVPSGANLIMLKCVDSGATRNMLVTKPDRPAKERQPRHTTPIPVEVSNSASVATERRSEEHTSELQSLMRISYAVFCLKKKKQITHNR